jgi:hypothetical protein
MDCAWPLLANGVFTCGRGGSDRWALLRAARHVGGMHVGGIERGRCGQGCCSALRGDPGHAMRLRSTQGAPPPMGYGARIPEGHMVAVGAALHRRAAESASGVQLRQRQYADGERAELALDAHQSCTTVRAPFLPTAFARARAADVGSDRSALIRARGMSGGCMSWGIEWGGAAAGPLRYSQRGPSHAM